MLKILELFGGIGACSKALERLGIDYEIADYVEIDKYAVKSFNAMHNTNFEPQDITTWDKDIDVDLVMHGSPCQDFSLAGLQAGGDEGSGTRSSLMYETIRIVKKLKPKYVIWENVKNLLSKKHRHNFDSYLEIMESLGYANYYQVLNAKDYGIPQNRERVFTISILERNSLGFAFDISSFQFPPKQELKLKLKDMLEDNVDEKYYLSDDKIDKISHWKEFQKPFEKVQGKNSIVPTLTARGAGEEHNGMITFSDNLEDTTNLQEQCLNIKNATKKGYQEAYNGDRVDLSQPNSKTRRGRVQKDSIQTLTTQNNLGVVIGLFDDTSSDNFAKGKRDYGYRDEYGTLKCQPKYSIYKNTDLRIRKLTPKECWRLMGFDDEDFEKASKVNSNTQLYKQAGNSIVVNVLENILKNLL